MTLKLHLLTSEPDSLSGAIEDISLEAGWTFTQAEIALLDYRQAELSVFDVILFDTRQHFGHAFACYQQLMARGKIGCPCIFVSDQYHHAEAETLAAISETYYLVKPDTQAELASYLSKFTRAKGTLFNRFNAMLHGDLGQLLDKTSIISIADTRGRIVYANQEFCNTSGYQLKELLGQNHRILKSGTHADDLYRDMWGTISRGNTWQGKVCNRRKDGSLYWVKSEIHPICDAHKRPVFYFSIRQEITQEIELTQRLASNEEHLRLSNAFAKVVSFDWDFATNQVKVSDEVEALYGLKDHGNLIPQETLQAMIHPEDVDEALAKVNFSKSNDTEYKVEHRIIQPDGESRWVAKRAKVISDDNGQPVRMLGVVTDIQDLKEAQNRVEKANQIKTAFLTSLAHEVRNPLNAISGYAQLIASQPEGDSQDRAKRIVEICHYVIELLSEVDDLSKIEAGKFDLDIQTIHLDTLLADCRQVINPLLGSIRLFCDSTELHLKADRRYLKQVLINLLSNAIKYNKEMGRILVSAKTLGNGLTRIEIEDTGMGIAEDELDKIFIPFERLDWEKSEVQGLGLGLPLTKMLIEKMGGSIGVESQPGLGTRIWFELPSCDQDIEPQPETVPAGSAPSQSFHFDSGSRILLVEDNEFNQHFMAEQLGLYGLDIHHASNGREALKLLQQQPFDLILTDCNMPKMDGFELSRRIRASENDRLRTTPIVAITARSSKRSYQECQEAGINDILIKPIMAENLLQKIQENLRQNEVKPELKTEGKPRKQSTSATDVGHLIDQEVLHGYIGNDKNAQKKLLEIYRDLFKNGTLELFRAWEKQDYPAIQFEAHKLASSSLGVGASSLACSLRKLEDNIIDNRLDDLGTYIEHIKHLRPLLQRELDALIDGEAAVEPACEKILDLAKASHLRVLIIDDDEFAINHASHHLSRIGLKHIDSASSVAKALKQTTGGKRYDILLCDINMPGSDGLELIRLLSANYSGEGIVIYSGEKALINSAKNLIASYNMSFLGHLEKPFEKSQLIRLIQKRLEQPLSCNVENQASITDKEIREGIDNDAITLEYQPQTSTDSNQIVAVEALARFRCSNGEIISPGQFIPQIERMGLDYRFSICVFEKAVDQLAHWLGNGIDIKMAVNFSMNAIENLELPEVLANICKQHDIDTGRLVIEVTESEITSNPQVALEVLGRMRLQGFVLSIDDFGTGYSSLEKLQMLPFSELKLDRSYVSNACQEEVSMAIMKSSIELAKQLNMTTVAEGVENAEDMALSHEIGVDIIQGYHIAKPMSGDAVSHWIEEFKDAKQQRETEHA
ncbi:MAG: hypothetical protein AseanaTS_06550 [Candidatus Pelagadaptatus aseana]|uniref:EAL domain-containing protein n=1 Tax=Candidatus Pelagadaptatus aseana TaxID=3120508 RepID=UPI0039B2AFA4